ncbi:hypothetical protein Ahia01_000121800 [Argonauta hians]
MGKMQFELPPLSSASSFRDKIGDVLKENEDKGIVKICYKVGNVYKGFLENNRRHGRGIFYWIDGSWYDGDYIDGKRSGDGKQLFRDGSLYEGKFLNDLREGIGKQIYITDETYKGTFFKDFRHGHGNYYWGESTKFQGMFYLSKKEGYGTFTYSNGDVFQGLYRDDNRFGPGIHSYHNSNEQDVGLWSNCKLIRVSYFLQEGFHLSQFPHCVRIQKTECPTINLFDCWKVDSMLENARKQNLFYDVTSNEKLTEKLKNIYIDYQDICSWKINYEMFNQNYIEALEAALEENIHWNLWNRTPLLVQLQKHWLKHTIKEDLINTKDIYEYNRDSFGPKGILEKASESLLKSTLYGDVDLVESILEEKLVSLEVGDRNGQHPLQLATTIGSEELIEILLNNGANVNQLSDEGCSALTVGIIHMYPYSEFKKPIQIQKIGYLPNYVYNFARDILHEKFLATLGRPPSVSETEPLFWPELPEYVLNAMQLYPTAESPKVGEKDKFARLNVSSSALPLRKHSFEAFIGKAKGKIFLNAAPPNPTYGKLQEMKEISETVINSKKETSKKNVASRGSLISKRVSFRENIKDQEETVSKTLKYQRCVDLLLQRGADPNMALLPWPVLFFAIRAGDVEMVRKMLLKNASTSLCLPDEEGGISPLHLACGMPGKTGIKMTEILLDSLADPNARAAKDISYLKDISIITGKRATANTSPKLAEGGRTPLHIACARNDNPEDALAIVKLLLEKKANPNVATNGFSPLALAIAWGNISIVQELLENGADPNMELGYDVGSALNVLVSTQFENQYSLEKRFNMLDLLLRYGANLSSETRVGPKQVQLSIVDYANYMSAQAQGKQLDKSKKKLLKAMKSKGKYGKRQKFGKGNVGNKYGAITKEGKPRKLNKYGKFVYPGMASKVVKFQKIGKWKERLVKRAPFSLDYHLVKTSDDSYRTNYSHN